jgi:predicted nucleic acid-binding protein
VILDTNFVGHLATQDPGARALAGEFEGEPVLMRLPTSVIWEVFYGLANDTTQDGVPVELRRRYEHLINTRTVEDVDEHIARRAGTLRGKHSASDRLRNLDGADSFVAAHGLALGEPVISNDGDFQDVDGLDVVTY